MNSACILSCEKLCILLLSYFVRLFNIWYWPSKFVLSCWWRFHLLLSPCLLDECGFLTNDIICKFLITALLMKLVCIEKYNYGFLVFISKPWYRILHFNLTTDYQFSFVVEVVGYFVQFNSCHRLSCHWVSF